MSLAKDGSVPASIGLWIPNIVFTIITFFAVKQMGSEKWQSVIHLTSEWITSLSKRIGLIGGR
jgi:hypothetical protein